MVSAVERAASWCKILWAVWHPRLLTLTWTLPRVEQLVDVDELLGDTLIIGVDDADYELVDVDKLLDDFVCQGSRYIYEHTHSHAPRAVHNVSVEETIRVAGQCRGVPKEHHQDSLEAHASAMLAAD